MGVAFLYSPELGKPGSSLAKAPITIIKSLQLLFCFLNTVSSFLLQGFCTYFSSSGYFLPVDYAFIQWQLQCHLPRDAFSQAPSHAVYFLHRIFTICSYLVYLLGLWKIHKSSDLASPCCISGPGTVNGRIINSNSQHGWSTYNLPSTVLRIFTHTNSSNLNYKPR